MIELTLSAFFRAFESDWGKNNMLMGVAVKLPNGEIEYIINCKSNFNDKMEYYKNAYNEDLTLKANGEIRIVDYTFGDSFQEIDDTLI